MRNRSFPFLVLAICLCQATASFAQDKLLTIDDIFDAAKKVNFSGSVPAIKWLKDGKSYLQTNDPTKNLPRIQKVNAATGKAEPFFDSNKMQAAFAAIPGITTEDAKQLSSRGSYNLNPVETAVLINWANDLFFYELGSDRAIRLTNNPEEEIGESFSPDGRMVSFVRENNLYVEDLATPSRERALTRDGSAKILNGRLDWIYQEELYGRGNFEGYWWSPDSSMIAYLHLDEHPVPEFTVVDHIPLEQNVEVTPYPKAGDPNPIVSLAVVSAAGGAPRWIDTYKYQPDFLIARVAWSGDGKKIVFQAQNREQTFLDLNAADPKDGKSTTLLRETSKAWVEVIDNPVWLKDGSFIWQSEGDGWRHLYHYSSDGKLLRQITRGNWEVRGLDGVDEDKEFAYFSASEHSNIAPQPYRIKLDGSGLTRLTATEGSHRVDFNPGLTYFVDVWSDVNTPNQERLFDANGKLVRVIEENKVETLKQYKLGTTEFLQVKTRDGFPMDAQIIRPPNFDPKKKYPVMSFTYSGPHAPSVRNSWGGTAYLWHQMLAQKGYIIWICDNRSASGRGLEPTWMVYKNLGELELRDLEDGYSWLKSQPYVDGSRIGLWGWSYGGFMTSYALTHSQTFKLGIAGGTVSDWRNYDSIYTERVMQTPQNNLEGYKRSGPVFAAQDLHGKLLLIHGAIDDNVHMANTIQFVYELQKAGKQFELMLYPKSRHGVTNPVLVKHLRQMMMDFIQENL